MLVLWSVSLIALEGARMRELRRQGSSVSVGSDNRLSGYGIFLLIALVGLVVWGGFSLFNIGSGKGPFKARDFSASPTPVPFSTPTQSVFLTPTPVVVSTPTAFPLSSGATFIYWCLPSSIPARLPAGGRLVCVGRDCSYSSGPWAFHAGTGCWRAQARAGAGSP